MYHPNREIKRTLEQWYSSGEAPPAIFELYPTKKCNLSCRTCIQHELQKKNVAELTDEEFIRIVREAIEWGVAIFYIGGGGEPLLRHDLVIKLIELIKENRRGGSLTTNSTLLRESDLEKMVLMGWDDIHISIDGPTAEINDYLRGSGTFEKAVRALGWLNKYKSRHGNRSATEPFLNLNFVISKKNYRFMLDYLRFARENNADYVLFNPMILHDPSRSYLQLTERDWEEVKVIMDQARALAGELNLRTSLGDIGEPASGSGKKGEGPSPSMNDSGALPPWNNLKNKLHEMLKGKNEKNMSLENAFCLKPWYHFVLHSDGYAGPCCIYKNPEINVRGRPMREVWLSEFFSQLRRAMLIKALPPSCRACPPIMLEEDLRLKKTLLRMR